MNCTMFNNILRYRNTIKKMSVFLGNVKYFIVICCCWMIWSGCNVINPVEPTPTYVHVDSFSVITNKFMPLQPYTLSHSITTVWVYYDNNLIGEYDLPATFPIITDGTNTGKLELFPGIVINGLNNNVDMYPFFQPDTGFTVIQKPGKITTYVPTTQYYTDTKIQHIANFDFGTILNFGLQAGNVPIVAVTSPDSLVFEGTGSGSIYMTNPGIDSSVDSTVKSYVIDSGVSAYIEFNYKSDVQFYVGMSSNLSATIGSDPFYLAGINPSPTWQKFYLEITAFLNQYHGVNYKFYIKTSLPVGQTTGMLLIDNIHLVSF